MKIDCSHCAGIGTLEATDIFCGAGGSSLGLEFVRCPHCGRSLIKVTQALNHWDLAVQAHNANFPDADHDVHDVQVISAKRFRRTDLLWASPECVHHAYCRGPKSDSEDAFRSRATFTDIIRFTEHHRYDGVIIENVVEARLWCEKAGHGDRCSCGATFDRWLNQMCDLGYEAEIIYFNSQFALPTPQSRDRMYVVFWRKGLPEPNLKFRPPSWCVHCQAVTYGVLTWKKASSGSLRDQKSLFRWGRYGQQYVYTCPYCRQVVAPAVTGAKTIIDWSIDSVRIGDREKPLAPKTRARIKTGLERLSTNRPVTVQVGGNLYERPGYARVWSVDDPLRTVVGTRYMGLVTPAGSQEAAARSLEEPSHTVTSSDRLATVLRVDEHPPSVEGQAGPQRGSRELSGLSTDAMIVPTARGMKDGKDVRVAKSVEEPLPTVSGSSHEILVQVNRGGEARRARDIDEPTQTIAGHGELALVELRNHGTVREGDVPMHTVCGGGYHHGVLVYNGMPGFVRPLEDAAGTVTSRDKQSLLVPYYSTGIARQTDEPMNTVSTKDREALVITDEDIDACLFRMLQWQELLKAQMMHLMPDGSQYQLTARRRSKDGKMRELSNELRVRMIGNAVSSPVATMLGRALLEILR